jgi:hypothetical protein
MTIDEARATLRQRYLKAVEEGFRGTFEDFLVNLVRNTEAELEASRLELFELNESLEREAWGENW